MKIYQYFFVGLLIIGINLSACSKEVVEEEKTKEKIEKKEEKKEKTEKVKEEKREEKKEKEKTEDPPQKFTAPPQNKEELPIIPFDHFGGMPTSLDMDEELLFVGFGRKLDILNFDLKLLGFIPLRGVVRQVTSIQIDHTKYLFVKEEGGLLEIVKVILGAAPQLIKTFQPFGGFDGPFKAPNEDSFHFFVSLEDKIQILDVTNPADIQVEFELFIPGVSQVFGGGDYLYVVQNKYLKIVDWRSMATLSSIPIQTPFKILGTYQKEEVTYLILGLLSADTLNIRAIQSMPLSPSGGGVTQLGVMNELGFEAEKVVRDTTQPYLYILHEGKASLYDLEKQIVLRGSQNPLSFVSHASGRGGVAFLASPDFLGKLIYRMNDTNANLSSSQVNFLWEKSQIKPIAGEINMVHLLGLNHVLVTHQSDTSDHAPLFYLAKRTHNSSQLKPVDLGFKGESHFTLSYLAPFGLFFYDETRGKIFYMGENLTHGEEMNFAGQWVKGITTSQEKEKKYLYLTVNQKEGRGQTALMTYQFNSAQEVKVLASFSLGEVGGVVTTNNGRRALVACGSKGICDMQLSDNRQSIKLTQKIALKEVGAIASELVLSPDHQWVYVYQELEGKVVISIHDLKNSLKEVSRITGVSLSPLQFKGLTFSLGGNMLLLPHDKGVNFYDVTHKITPTLKFTWSLGPAYYIDVTNRGQTFCVALGKNGVECAEWE